MDCFWTDSSSLDMNRVEVKGNCFLKQFTVNLPVENDVLTVLRSFSSKYEEKNNINISIKREKQWDKNL